jgi:hypothetical protein
LEIIVQASPAPSVSLNPDTPQSLEAGQTLDLSAAVSNDSSHQGVTWTLSGAGSLANTTSTTVTYVAPSSLTSPANVRVVATAVSDGTEFASLPILVFPVGQKNVHPVSVDTDFNTLYTTVTVCVPGTSQCNTIDHVLVDTGSTGLRLLSSAGGGELSVSLPKVTSGGAPIQSCAFFADTSYLWGDVAKADVYIAGEVAKSVPIQVAQDPNTYAIPRDCTNGSTFDDNTRDNLGANGILGVGPEPTDCTLTGVNYCDSMLQPAYFTCSAASCPEFAMPANLQLTNPVTLFPKDDNGVIIELASVSGVTSTVSGSMTFGIGTEANNGVGGATVFTQDANGAFTTHFSGQTLPASYIDSGTSAYLFPANLPNCGGVFSGLFCPASPQALSAQNSGATTGTGTVQFTVDDVSREYTPDDAVYPNAGGSSGAYPCSGPTCTFVWGLPFFYGRKVFTAIDLKIVTGQPATPWWAY